VSLVLYGVSGAETGTGTEMGRGGEQSCHLPPITYHLSPFTASSSGAEEEAGPALNPSC